MRRSPVLLLAAALLLGVLALPASADDHLPDHGHVLLLHADFEPNPDFPEEGPPFILHGFEKCVELANARKMPAQHDNLHFGTAGQMLLTKAGHMIVPLAPFPGVPFESCADLEAAFNGG